MKKTMLMAAALTVALAAPALAETYRVVQGGANNAIFIVPESLKKTGDKANVSVVAILAAPRPSGLHAQELTMVVDCGAKTFQQTGTIDLDGEHKELARRAANSPASAAPAGSMGEKLISFACSGTFPADAAPPLADFPKAVAWTKQYTQTNAAVQAKLQADAKAK